MTIEFQLNVLKYLIQTKECSKYIEMLDDKLFDLENDKLIFSFIKKYVEKFGVIPSQTNFIEYVIRLLPKLKRINKDKQDEILNRIKECYIHLQSDVVMIKEDIIEYAKRKKIKNLFRDNIEKINDGDDGLFRKLSTEISQISAIGNDVDEGITKGPFVLDQFTLQRFKDVEGNPTWIKGLNKMTSARGFYSPQLIVFLGGPKSFKTGFLIKLVMEYVRDGKKVYYCDVENGVNAITTRFYMSMLECSKYDLMTGKYDNELTQMVKKFKALGGDLKVDFYAAHQHCINDVEENLKKYKEEYNWVPDIIVYDYPDRFAANDKSVKESRLVIQRVYHDIIALNTKIGAFSFGISPVKREAITKEHISITDFSEDIGKAYNCHAAFAICRTEQDLASGKARLVPIVQREGVGFGGGVCKLAMNPEIASIIEDKFEIENVLSSDKHSKSSLNDD